MPHPETAPSRTSTRRPGPARPATRIIRAANPAAPRNRECPMAEDQIFTGRAAGQHAVAGFEAAAGYARERLRPWTADAGEGGREPGQDHDRLSGLLCALRH